MYPNNNVKKATRRNELSYFRNDIGIAIASISKVERQVFDNKYRLLKDIQVFGAEINNMRTIDHAWIKENHLPSVCEESRCLFPFSSYRYKNRDNVYSHGLNVIDKDKALGIFREQIEISHYLKESLFERSNKNKLVKEVLIGLLAIKESSIKRVEILLDETIEVDSRVSTVNEINHYLDIIRSELNKTTELLKIENWKMECKVRALIATAHYIKLNPFCHHMNIYRKNKRLKEIEARQKYKTIQKYKDILMYV